MIAVIIDKNIIKNIKTPEPLSFRFKTAPPRRMYGIKVPPTISLNIHKVKTIWKITCFGSSRK